MLPRFLLPVLLGAVLLGPARAGEGPKPPEPLYETREKHDPSGIGKFFLGREIAQVMGHQAAGWLERPQREEEEKTDQMIEALKFREGEVVADIGCGSGYVARRIAKKVGEKGRVYGVDIQPEMLELLGRRMKEAGIGNVVPVLGETADPKLPAASCDTMILVDVYHEFDQPFEMTQGMLRALKPGGRLVFVEFKAEDPKIPIRALHKMSEAQLKKEMGIHPLEWVETIATLPWQHAVIFQKK